MYEGHIKKDIKYWKIPRDSDEIGRLMQFFPVLLQLTLLLSLPHIYAFHSLYGNLADVLSLLHSLYIYLVFTHLSRLQGFCRVPHVSCDNSTATHRSTVRFSSQPSSPGRITGGRTERIPTVSGSFLKQPII
ncbi:hypothetical protein F4815DRAFT_30830 [Daldinia loculata]|nr:hypothetical protein F4815DRAFT_30830 [Daldinia loculata]